MLFRSEKILALYEQQYNPALKKVTSFLQNTNSEIYFQEIVKTFQMKRNSESKKKLALPYNILKNIAEEGDVRRTYAYLRKVNEEKKTVEANAQLRGSAIGIYATRILNSRITSTKAVIGEMTKRHLTEIMNEITDLNEQSSFIRYEMINGRKESIKKKMAGKNIAMNEAENPKDRSFYIQNGYEFYPFQGEYWLDEVGNYHYIGKQSCE